MTLQHEPASADSGTLLGIIRELTEVTQRLIDTASDEDYDGAGELTLQRTVSIARLQKFQEDRAEGTHAPISDPDIRSAMTELKAASAELNETITAKMSSVMTALDALQKNRYYSTTQP